MGPQAAGVTAIRWTRRPHPSMDVVDKTCDLLV